MKDKRLLLLLVLVRMNNWTEIGEATKPVWGKGERKREKLYDLAKRYFQNEQGGRRFYGHCLLDLKLHAWIEIDRVCCLL